HLENIGLIPKKNILTGPPFDCNGADCNAALCDYVSPIRSETMGVYQKFVQPNVGWVKTHAA
ncbi:MAG: hypothetical protein ACI92Z_000233, partial [Paracoccaceae bacterium]